MRKRSVRRERCFGEGAMGCRELGMVIPEEVLVENICDGTPYIEVCICMTL